MYEHFRSADAEILVILGDSLERARAYAEQLNAPFPVLSDSQRGAYHRFGLEKALLLVQRTASVIVDRDGIIRYIKSTTNPMTWLQESRELLGFVDSLK